MNRAKLIAKLRKEIQDQAAHMALAAVVLAPLAIAPNPFVGLVVGLILGLALEVKEEGSTVTRDNIRKALGSRLDLAFYAIGGAIVGGIAGALA